jgi:hypothetical protein
MASMQKLGAGCSIVVDRNGHIIAGNKTAEGAKAAGLENVIGVETDGSQLFAVVRTDLDLDDPKARELAIADNRTAELGLEWTARCSRTSLPTSISRLTSAMRN